MEQEFILTKEETEAFTSLKEQAQTKQKELDQILGAIQGALHLLRTQKGHPSANASLSTDNTKLVVTVPDPEPEPEPAEA